MVVWGSHASPVIPPSLRKIMILTICSGQQETKQASSSPLQALEWNPQRVAKSKYDVKGKAVQEQLQSCARRCEATTWVVVQAVRRSLGEMLLPAEHSTFFVFRSCVHAYSLCPKTLNAKMGLGRASWYCQDACAGWRFQQRAQLGGPRSQTLNSRAEQVHAYQQPSNTPFNAT